MWSEIVNWTVYLLNSTVKVDTMTKSNQTLSAQIEQLLSGLDSQEEVAEATKLLHKRFFEKSLENYCNFNRKKLLVAMVTPIKLKLSKFYNWSKYYVHILIS